MTALDSSAPPPAADFDPQAFLKTLTTRPGVYRMIGAKGEVLYVGKARNLKRRVASYFRANPDSAKVRSLVSHIHQMEITVTNTEGEALLLESNLIKEHRPRYNVLLRDDKSYPHLHLSAGTFPRLTLHRGPKRGDGRYFGPYPSASAVRDTLYQLQRAFRLRSCDDSFFAHRSRPCLQYQIRRCSGPCTGMISTADNRFDVENAAQFLAGKSDGVIEALVARMERAAEALEFEVAARLRDQIAQLRRIQARQYVSGERGDLDVVALAQGEGVACVQVFVFRNGQLLGNKAFFPQLPPGEETPDAVLGAFVAQYYADGAIPEEILLDRDLEDRELLAQALQVRSGQRVAVTAKVRGERARWRDLAQRNAQHALAARLSSRAGMRRRLEALRDALELSDVPERLECFDISHTQGEAPVAACVVFDAEGPVKSDYRRYNVDAVAPGDDYGALRQALTRRYTRAKQEQNKLPDLVLIDGGKGQLRCALEVFAELQLLEVPLVGVSKGADRRAGQERLHRGDQPPLVLAADSPALQVIQQIRDEAHRFAITGHRQRRAANRRGSVLEDIPGVGPKRRQRLLKQFGGLRQLARAGVEDIARVEGISKALAQRIVDILQGGE
ncbi:MAG: excinuclease ABC subunit UvrC [Candidatus Competibacterales bacterium]